MHPRNTQSKTQNLECLIDNCTKKATEDLGPLKGKWICKHHSKTEDVKEKVEEAKEEMNICKTC